jgi:hypothetical protein
MRKIRLSRMIVGHDLKDKIGQKGKEFKCW